MPGKPFQSKLLPHLDFIRECRVKRLSYPRIAAELHARFGMKTAPANIHSFVKVRPRRGNIITLPTPTPSEAATRPAASRPDKFVQTAGIRDHWKFYDPTKPLVKDAS